MVLQFSITHSCKLADVVIKVEAKPAVGLVGVDTDTDDRCMISLPAKELCQHEAIFDVNEIRDGSLVRESDEPLPQLWRPLMDQST